MSQKNDDLKKMKKLIDLMKENDLVEVEIKHGDDKILLKRSSPQQQIMTAIPMNTAAAHGSGMVQTTAAGSEHVKEQDDGLVEITSPLVGTFYATPSPDSEPFVEAGTKIEPQTVVCIIEAMKVMNEIKAEISGTIVKIEVSSGQAVEYGQVLFKVKPD